MNIDRRKFLESLLGGAVLAASGKLYSIPSIVAPKNIQPAIKAGFAARLDGSLPAQLYVGDIITISGNYAINPITRRPTTYLQNFLVTSVVNGASTLAPVPLERFNG